MSFSPSINKLLAMPHARARREWQVVKVRSVAKSDVYIRGERPKLDGHRPRRPQGRLSVGVGKKAKDLSLVVQRVRIWPGNATDNGSIPRPRPARPPCNFNQTLVKPSSTFVNYFSGSLMVRVNVIEWIQKDTEDFSLRRESLLVISLFSRFSRRMRDD